MNDKQFDQVVDHVLAELNSGVSEQAIRQEMHDKGYPAHLTEQVFEEIHITTPAAAEEPVKETVTDNIVDAAAYITSRSIRVQGRVGRLGFLMTIATLYAIVIIPSLILMLLFTVIPRDALSGIFTIVVAILAPLFFGLMVWVVWLRFTVCVRRMHDMGYSGTLAALTFLGFLDLILYIILFTTPGKSEDNKYGPPNPEINPLRLLRFIK